MVLLFFAVNDRANREEWQTEYHYEEHYFLTDPDQLINNHFPDESDWQLLQDPRSLTDFEVSVISY